MGFSGEILEPSAGIEARVVPHAGASLAAGQALACLEGDEIAARALAGLPHYARISLEEIPGRDGETVVLVSAERILAQHAALLRQPNVRVIALSDKRFQDPRLDGGVYAYLPADTPPTFVERIAENALDLIHLLSTRRKASQELIVSRSEIGKLNEIGARLSAELDTEKLLELILTKAREITRSDAGSLYLVEEVPLPEGEPSPQTSQPQVAGARLVLSSQERTRKALRFELAQNDSLSVPFRQVLMDISDQSIAGYVALTGEVQNLEDAYHLSPGKPYSYNRKFDEESGYRTRSVLAVPMRNPHGEVVGVLQLINAKRSFDTKLAFDAQPGSPFSVEAQVIPFERGRQQALVESLASQAAVALENSRLYGRIQRMFEGFVRASITAIEARDPTTSGHSFQVANLTVALAEAADRSRTGPYAELRFSREQMKEIRYAALLHDFGKVGVREKVLVKEKKLYPEQLDMIRQRFHFVKRSMQLETLQAKLDYVLSKGREQLLQKLPEFDAELAAEMKEVDEYFRVILAANEPTVLPAGDFSHLAEIAARHFLDFDGQERELLTGEEVRLLSIRKGSLDEEERRQIEEHVVHSYNFLAQIPWTEEIRGIPEIARGHHEKLNRTGYPLKLSAPEIPLQTRMMTISDIYEALVARDRPYKKAVSPQRALEILGQEVEDGQLDANLFRLFLEARIFEKLKVEPYPY